MSIPMPIQGWSEKHTYLGYTFEYEEYDYGTTPTEDLPAFERNENFQQLITDQHALRKATDGSIDQIHPHRYFGWVVSKIMKCSCLHNIAQRISLSYKQMAEALTTFGENCRKLTEKTREINRIREGDPNEIAKYPAGAIRVNHPDFYGDRATMRQFAQASAQNSLGKAIAAATVASRQRVLQSLS